MIMIYRLTEQLDSRIFLCVYNELVHTDNVAYFEVIVDIGFGMENARPLAATPRFLFTDIETFLILPHDGCRFSREGIKKLVSLSP
jgi:hypothetical protein